MHECDCSDGPPAYSLLPVPIVMLLAHNQTVEVDWIPHVWYNVKAYDCSIAGAKCKGCDC